MGDVTGIQWTDHTFNPWWGCSRVSPACRSCYADTQAQRYGFQVWRRHGPRRMLSEANWARPLKWNREAEAADKPAKVFCASMADVFEDHPDVTGARKRLWDVIEATPWLRWQLLTKRPENVNRMVPWGADWPSWVWLGASVETPRFAEQRIPLLHETGAQTLFLSCEPLLAPLNLTPWIGSAHGRTQEPRRRDLSGRGDGGVDDRLGRPDLAPGRATNRPLATPDAHHPVCAPPGREPSGEIHAGTRDVRRASSSRTSSPIGVAPLQWPYPGWADREPQERQPNREPTRQSRTGNLPGAGSPCSPNPAARSLGPVGYTQRDGDADHGPGTGDLLQEGRWGVAARDRSRLWRGDADGLQNSEGRPALSWLIIGGESGPNARPTELAWIEDLVAQCRAAGIAPFVKQLGKVLGQRYGAGPKGAGMERWPESVRVREFPAAAEAVTA